MPFGIGSVCEALDGPGDVWVAGGGLGAGGCCVGHFEGGNEDCLELWPGMQMRGVVGVVKYSVP